MNATKTPRQILLLAVVAGALIVSLVSAQDPKGESLQAPVTSYKGRTVAQTMSFHGAPWLIRDTRDAEERPKQLLKALKIKKGQTVADIGCGNGFYTLQMAQRVGKKGRVLAVDIQQEMLDLLDERAREAGVNNVEPILGGPADPRLPKGEVDLILLVDVYHEFAYPEQMLAAMRKSLKPDGVIALAEYRGEDRSVPIKPLHKMGKEQILKEYLPNGFKLVREFDKLPWQHLMFFGRT